MQLRLLRRFWSPGMGWGLPLGILGILLLQVGCSYLAWGQIQSDPYSTLSLVTGYAMVGLSLGFPLAILMDGGRVRWWARLLARLLGSTRDGVGQWLLPGYCGWRFGELRRDGTLREMLGEGYSPGQILLRTGLAAVGPFLAASLLCDSVSLVLMATASEQFLPPGMRSNVLGYSLEFWFRAFLGRLLWCVVLVELGALGSGPWRGMLLCYLGGIGMRVLQLGAMVLLGWPVAGAGGEGTRLLWDLSASGVLAAAALVLLPVTLRSLAGARPAPGGYGVVPGGPRTESG